MGDHLATPKNGILYTNEPPINSHLPVLNGHFSCVPKVVVHSRFYCNVVQNKPS